MSKEERIAYFQTDYANMAPATRARMEEDLMRHYFTPRYQCTPFDPSDLVALAQDQIPERPELAEALARCTQQWKEDELCGYFQDPKVKRRRTSLGAFILVCPRQGSMLFEVDKDGGIVAVNYLADLMRREEVWMPVSKIRIVHWK